MPEAIRGSRHFAGGESSKPTYVTCDRCGLRNIPGETAKRRPFQVCTDCKGDKVYLSLRQKKG